MVSVCDPAGVQPGVTRACERLVVRFDSLARAFLLPLQRRIIAKGSVTSLTPFGLTTTDAG